MDSLQPEFLWPSLLPKEWPALVIGLKDHSLSQFLYIEDVKERLLSQYLPSVEVVQ